MPCQVESRQWLEMTAIQHPFFLVGTATIEYTDTDTPVLGNLFVHPSLRRIGIATQLVREAKQWGRAQGKDLYLHVQPGNQGAIDLYGAEGFEPTGEVAENGSVWMCWEVGEEVPRA